MSVSKQEMEEREHFCKVVSSFLNYQLDSTERIRQAENHVRKIPLEQQKILSKLGFLDNLKSLESCVELNYALVKEIVADAATMFENVPPEKQGHAGLADSKLPGKRKTLREDVEKVHTTLKQFVRDWSDVGADERKSCYSPIILQLQEVFQDKNPQDIKVLVPGAGLGRLAFDIAKLGYECQGNEFSLYMLLASNFVLNKCRNINCFKFYPWVHQFTNNLKTEDMLEAVTFPDVDPNDLPEDSKFSMTAGDFLEVYSDPEYEASQDCVITCFFIDCAHNILDFIELIFKILKPGGKWINFGPLLYHFSDMERELSLEPSYDIVQGIIKEIGFKYIKEETDVEAPYMQKPKSMLHFSYKCVFFTCEKPL